MQTKTKLTIIHLGKRVNVYTNEELNKLNLTNKFLLSLNQELKKNKINY